MSLTVIVCIIIFVGLATSPAWVGAIFGRSEKRAEARIYANWLNRTYPNRSTISAAIYRVERIDAKGVELSKTDQRELYRANLVLEGWHLNDGTQV